MIDTDFVFLPCSDEELQRSARRLNTSFPYDLSVTIDDTSFRNDEAMKWIRDEDVFTLNRYAQLLDGLGDEETDRFLSAVDFANQYLGGVNDLQTAVKIGTSLHAFTLYPNVMCDEDLGATLLGEYDVPEELWEFIDKERLGKHFRENESGRYTDKGYVGVNDWSAIRQYLKPKEGMGGIE